MVLNLSFLLIVEGKIKRQVNTELKIWYNGIVIKQFHFLYARGNVMSPKDIGDLISQVGFPIVVTLLLLYQQMKTSDSYYQLIEQVKNLVENNTKVLASMIEKQNNEGK